MRGCAGGYLHHNHFAEPCGELLAIAAEDLLGNRKPWQRFGKGPAYCPSGGPCDNLGHDAISGMVIHFGGHLRL